ncbi:MAG: S53 family peptidase [Acidimicrobiales bacterium]
MGTIPKLTRSPKRRRRAGAFALLAATLVVGGIAGVSFLPASSSPTLSKTASQAAGSMHFDIVLKPRSLASLEAFVQEVSTPTSRSYGKFLTVKEFGQRFGALPSSVRSVTTFLQGFGPIRTHLNANGILLRVQGPPGVISRAIDSTITSVTQPLRGTQYVAISPTIPPQIAPFVLNYTDLNIASGTQSAFARQRLGAPLAPEPLGQASGTYFQNPGCPQATDYEGLTPSQVADLYGISSLPLPANPSSPQTIALAEYTDPTLPGHASSPTTQAIASFSKCFGLHPSIQYSPVDGGASNAKASNEGEVVIDVDGATALAPTSKIDVSYSYDSYSNEFAMVAANTASVISISWGSCAAQWSPNNFATEQLINLEAAAQGQTIVAASGDSGSSGCYIDKKGSTAANVDYPAGMPNVLGVGGVTYSLTQPSTPSVWNNADGVSGGGLSTIFSAPFYQRDVVSRSPEIASNCPAGRAGCRAVPDVAMLSDGMLMNFPGQGWSYGAGTSLAAPLFAAGLSDVETIVHHRFGLINPLLYSLASIDPSIFHQPATGTNEFEHFLPGRYPVTPGYNLATGLGTVNFDGLYQWVVSQDLFGPHHSATA